MPQDRKALASIEQTGDRRAKVPLGITYIKGHFRAIRIIRKKYRDPRGVTYYINLPEKYQNCMGRTKATESLISKLLAMHFEDGMTLGDIEHWLKDKGINFSHATIMGWFEKAAVILTPLDKPLQEEITDDAYMHSDESTLKTCDTRLPGKGEVEEDVEPGKRSKSIWRKSVIRCICIQMVLLSISAMMCVS